MADYTLEQALRMSKSTVESQETTSTILVDVDTREITIPEGELLFGVEDDEKVEIKHIKLNKRYIDGNVDLSQFQFRISYENANGDRNYDIVTNVSVSESAIEFDWLLGRSVTLYNGTTSFIVCAVTVNTSTGKVTNEWNSAIGKGNVKKGIKATSESIGGKDLVAQLQTLISTATLLSNNAIEASSRAENSANSAAQSAAAADKRATDAAKSSANADRTANSIKDSMAQISENKEAVSKLKGDLANAENALGLYKPQKVIASTEAANTPYTVINNINLVNGKKYTIISSLMNTIDKKFYLSVYDSTGSLIRSCNIPAGETSAVIEFTADRNYENVYITAQVNYSNISVTIEIIESGEHQNNIDKLNDRIYSTEQDFKELKESAILQSQKSEIDFSGSDNGHYINYNGNYVETIAFSITKPFDVKKGDIITAKCAGYDTQVAIIAKVLGDKYIPLVISTDRNVNEYTYTTDENMTCVISYWNAKDHSATIGIKHDLNAIEKAVTELETYSSKWAYNLWKVLCIGDSLTSGASYAEAWGEVGQTGKSIDQNYPRILGRMINAEVTNGGVSGYSASNWYTDEASKYNFADYDTFIIWLGTNNGLDYEDEEQYFRNLINKIKADNTSCLIVLTKIFACSKGTVAGTNAIIDTIAEEYELPVIDNSDISHSQRPDLHANVANPHFGKAGNIFIANRYVEELGKWFEADHLRSEYGYTSRTN